MSRVSERARQIRVEHAILGCPGDRGFALRSSSIQLGDAEYSKLAGLGDQGSGELLRGRAVTLGRLPGHVALIITHPDSGARKRAGSVVTHAFLISEKDYDAIGCDPLMLLEQVEGKCSDQLPEEASSAFELSLGPASRSKHLQELPCSLDRSRQLAPLVAARLAGSKRREVIEVKEEPLACLAVVIALSPRYARRAFTFTTSLFSRDATRLDLVVTTERVDGRGEHSRSPSEQLPEDLICEAEHLLQLGPDKAAERIDLIDHFWPPGAPRANLCSLLGELREADQAERSGDYAKMLRQARSVMERIGETEIGGRIASTLLLRACSDVGHGLEALETLPATLATFDERGQLRAVLAEIDAAFDRVPHGAMLGVVACVERYFVERSRKNPLRLSTRRLVEEAVGRSEGDPALPKKLEWVLKNGPKREVALWTLIEEYALRSGSEGLRAAARLDARDFPSEEAFLESRIALLVAAVKYGKEAVDTWFRAHRKEFRQTSGQEILRRILGLDGPADAKQAAIDRILSREEFSVLGGLPDLIGKCGAEAVMPVVESLARGFGARRDSERLIDLLRALLSDECRVSREDRHQLAQAAIRLWDKPAAVARPAPATVPVGARRIVAPSQQPSQASTPSGGTPTRPWTVRRVSLVTLLVVIGTAALGWGWLLVTFGKGLWGSVKSLLG